MVSGSYDYTICIWAIDTGEMVASPLEGHTDCVTCVAFSPDGKHIVSSSDDKTIRIWKTPYVDKFSDCHFDSLSGWFHTSDGHGLLFWVPPHHRGSVCGTDTITVMNRNMTKFDFADFVHGTDWMKCHK